MASVKTLGGGLPILEWQVSHGQPTCRENLATCGLRFLGMGISGLRLLSPVVENRMEK